MKRSKGVAPLVAVALAGLTVMGAVATVGVTEATGTTDFFSSVGSSQNTNSGSSNEGSGTQMVSYKEFGSIAGVSVPNGTYDVVFIPKNEDGTVDAANYGSPDVTKIGADTDESDTQELFKSKDVEKGKDYYVASDGSFDNLPPAGNYKYAVIGSSTANKYGDVPSPVSHSEQSIPSKIQKLRVEQGSALEPMSSVDIYSYPAGVTADSTKVVNDGTAIALDADYTAEKSDSEVDGTVTGVKTWTVDGTDTMAQFGEVSVSNVNGNVSEITVRVMADGSQVMSVSDSDFSDGNGLDDGVAVSDKTDNLFQNAEDKVTVEMDVQFDDSATTSAVTLAKVTLDDTDDDSSSDDGSYGFSAVSESYTGY